MPLGPSTWPGPLPKAPHFKMNWGGESEAHVNADADCLLNADPICPPIADHFVR